MSLRLPGWVRHHAASYAGWGSYVNMQDWLVRCVLIRALTAAVLLLISFALTFFFGNAFETYGFDQKLMVNVILALNICVALFLVWGAARNYERMRLRRLSNPS